MEFDNDVDPCVKSILDGMDSYWDDLADSLTVTTMVNNAVIKGVVSAIEKDAAENSRTLEMGLLAARNLVRDLRDEFETKLSEQRAVVSAVTKNWEKMVDEISTARRDLDDVYLDNALESSDECDGGGRKDHSPWKVGGNHAALGPAINDSPQLKIMTKEQLISYFKTEMTKMKRQHDQALQEKTEELFRLKRELLNEKGSSSLHFRKEKDVDLVRKVILEFMAKIDAILLDNDAKLPIAYHNQELSHGLKERTESFLTEIQGLTSLRAHADTQDSSSDANLVNEIEKLHFAVEEAKMETTIRECVYITLLHDFVNELERFEGFELARKFTEDTHSFIYRVAVGDVLTGFNSVVAELHEEKSYAKKTLCSEIEENRRLKEEIASLLTLLNVKEKSALDSGAELARQKEYLDVLCHELDKCRDKINDQEIIISNSKRELNLLSFKLEETFQHIQQSEVEISNLKQKFKAVSNALREAERQKNVLCVDIQEKQEKLASVITKEKEQKKRLEGILVSMLELSKVIEDCENRLTECVGKNESRCCFFHCSLS